MSFRWEWVLIPLACLLAFWFLSAIEPAFDWDDIKRFMGVEHTGEYGKLAILGCVVVAIVAIARVMHKGDED